MANSGREACERLTILNQILESAAMKSLSTPASTSTGRKEVGSAEDKENMYDSADLSDQTRAKGRFDSYEEIARLESFVKEVEELQDRQNSEDANTGLSEVIGIHCAAENVQYGTNMAVVCEAKTAGHDEFNFNGSESNVTTDGNVKGDSERSSPTASRENELNNMDVQVEKVSSIPAAGDDFTTSAHPQPATRIRTTPAKESCQIDKLAEDRKARFKALAANIDEFEVDFKPRNAFKRPAPRTMALVSGSCATEARSPRKTCSIEEGHVEASVLNMENVSGDTVTSLEGSAVAAVDPRLSTVRLPVSNVDCCEIAPRNNEETLPSTASVQSPEVIECGIESFFRRKSPSTAKVDKDSDSTSNIFSSGSRVRFSKDVAVIDAYDALDIHVDGESASDAGKKSDCDERNKVKAEMVSFPAIRPGHVAILAKQFESNLPPPCPENKTVSVAGLGKCLPVPERMKNFTAGRRSPKRLIEESEQEVCVGNVKKLRAKWQVADQTGKPFENDDSAAPNYTSSQNSQAATSKQSCKDALSDEDLEKEGQCQYDDDRTSVILDDVSVIESERLSEGKPEECGEKIHGNIGGNDGTELGSSTELDVKDLEEDTDDDSCFLYQEKSSVDYSYTTSEILSGGEGTPALSSSSAVKDVGSRLRSVSSYRCHVKERLGGSTPNKLVYKFPGDDEPPKKSSATTAGRNSEQRFIQKLQELKELERVQLEHIHQASRAINLCLSIFNFRGSPEEIDAQKALLLATEKRRCITSEIERITHCFRERHDMEPTEPLGTLTVAHISVPLRMEYIRRVLLPGESSLVYYFICMLKYRETVYSTQMTSTEAACSGFLEFSNYFQIDCLPPDFELKFELYCLMSEKRDDYHQHVDKKNSFSLTLKKAKTARMPNRGGLPAISDASFKLVGDAKITLATVRRSRFNLENLNMLIPVEGMFMMRSRCCPHSVIALKAEKGFLNVCNQAGVWQLFWCIMKEGVLEFWRFPEDVSKVPLKTIDLHFCIMLKPAGEEITSRPNTMVLEMSVSDANDQEPINQLLSADSEEEYERWRESIDRVLSFTKVWGAELPYSVPSVTSV
uniref:PH domain-containing protein n=1 Tax=Trichuris muris TaxID=70415 RepID=A0A5S6QJB7_TRIMR